MAPQLPLFPEAPVPVPRPTPRDAPGTPERVALLPPVQADTSLAAAATAFDEHLVRDGKTDNTRRAFASDLRLLAERLGSGRSVGAISVDDLQQFLTWMLEYRAQPCSDKTYARRVTTLKVFFGWLHDIGAIGRDPSRPLVHRRAVLPLPLVLTDDEVARLLASAQAVRSRRDAPDPRPALLVRLLLDTGLKKGELARLNVGDVDAGPDEPVPSLLVRYDESPRWKDKARRVTLSPHALGLLDEYTAHYQASGRLFACTPRNLEYVLEDLVAAAGLPPKTSFETLRWTSALRAWRSGMLPEDLRERLGLSPVTWADTKRKLELLAATVGPERGVGAWFGELA